MEHVSSEMDPMVVEHKETRVQVNGHPTASTNIRRAPTAKSGEPTARTEDSGTAVSASDRESALGGMDEIGEALRDQGLT
jgi:hypothetical protein